MSFVARHALWSDEQKEAAARLRRLVEERNLETIRLSFADQHGILRGKTLVAAEALAWAASRMAQGPVLVYSTAEANVTKAVQERLGVEEAGAMVERTIAAVARGLVERGVRQLVVAGGETAGACVQALGIAQLQIGPQIDPGVPWCHARSGAAADGGLHVALKSGNFGGDDFFTRAFEALP